MKTCRQAWMRVSREVFDSLIELRGDGCYNCRLVRFGMGALRAALGLPENCTVLDASDAPFFSTNQVVLRLECPDFVQTSEGATLPEVEAWVWEGAVNGKRVPLFDRWEPDSVLIPELRRPPKPPFVSLKTWRDREPML